MAGCAALVKSVLASQAVYYFTPLSIPAGTFNYIYKIERAFLWSANDNTTSAKCKVNWDMICHLKKLGGLGVLHMGKFATVLRFRWPWLEWKDPSKIWVRSDNPCTVDDMEILYAATIITVGNGKKTPFSHGPWLGGQKPIDIAPSPSELESGQTLHGNAWVRNVDLEQDFSIEQLSQFVELWGCIDNFQPQPRRGR
jgi:hypothetical protein